MNNFYIKISVIIPVYNVEKYLSECITSVVNQTMHEIEIICINDGSTDNSLSILEDFAQKDNRIIIINQENKGLSGARNSGLKIAKGEYILFLDSDDSVESDICQKTYEKAIADNSDMVIFSVNVFDEKTSNKNDAYLSLNIFPKNLKNRVFNYTDCKDFFFRIMVTAWSKLYKKELLEKNNIKFIEGLMYEDNPFWIECFLSAKRISIVDEALINYRTKSITSISPTQNDEKKMDVFMIFSEIEKILKGASLYDEFRQAFEFHKKSTFIYWLAKIRDKRIKKKYLSKMKKQYFEFNFYPYNILWQNFRFKKKIEKRIKNNRVVIWGINDFIYRNIPENSPYITGLTDYDFNIESDINSNYEKIKIEDLKKYQFDFVLAISQSYYKYELSVKNILNENGYDIDVKTIS